MEADLVVRDDKNKITTATGDVEVRYQGRTMRAHELVYDETRALMTAKGEVQIVNADGSVQYADEIVLDDQMKAGVASGFAARLPQNIKIAAASAVRRSEQVQELNRAIYTPCDICVSDGSRPKTPTWSIRAESVVQDRDRQLIYYKNATVRAFGMPVLYLPLFWHPDPSAGRKSGLLTPKLGLSDRRGFSYEQPYLQVISPYSDLTLSPQINSKVNPLLNAHYRKRFYSGALDARFGYTYEHDFNGSGDPLPGSERTSRSYVLAKGAFAINPQWLWGFTAERTSDDYFFDKYEVGDVYEMRGPYSADDRRLISQVYAIRQDQLSYFSAAAFSIQGLRPGDNDRTFPVVAPLIEGRFEPARVAGGRLRVRTSAVALTRDQSALNPELRLDGMDSRRVTGEVDWRRTFTSANGVRVSPFVNLRGDAYSIDDLQGAGSRSKDFTRLAAVAGADVSWPFIRRFSSGTMVLEPIVQLAASPDVDQVEIGRDASGRPVFLNEDSLAFEFDETNLFRANKFPGYDLYEDGLRVNVGGRASVFWDDGRKASLLFGRSFRNERNEVFSAQTGLSEEGSDWIVAGDAQITKSLSVFGRTRLDGDDLEVERAELGANAWSRWGGGYVRYLYDRSAPIIDFDRTQFAEVENFDLGAEVFLTRHWGVTAFANRDLVAEAWVIRDIGLVYRDECTRVDFVYRREDRRGPLEDRFGTTESLAVRLTLATLGGPLYAD
jgi:LPS-assembly protein